MGYIVSMTITAIVQNGRIELPAGITLANGTEVNIVVPDSPEACEASAFYLPVFLGDGLQPGVALENRQQIAQLLEGDSAIHQP